MLREAATAPVIGEQKGYAGDDGPAIEAWLDTPGGIVVAANGDIYFADSNNHVIRSIDARNNVITTVGRQPRTRRGFSGDDGPATQAQLDTPDGVAIAPDGDLIVADSHNHRIRRVDRATRSHHDDRRLGRERVRRRRPAGHRGGAQHAERGGGRANGDIYIADTLNYRVRMIDARPDSSTPSRATADRRRRDGVGDGGPATSAHAQHAERRRRRAERRHLHRRHAPQPRAQSRRPDAHHHDRRGQRHAGATPAMTARPATRAWPGPRASRSWPNRARRQADDLHRRLLQRASARSGPTAIMRDVTRRRAVAFGAPTRVAFAPRRGWLYVADSSDNRIVPLTIPKVAPSSRRRRHAATARAGAMSGQAGSTPPDAAAPLDAVVSSAVPAASRASVGPAAGRDRPRRAAPWPLASRHRLRPAAASRFPSRSPLAARAFTAAAASSLPDRHRRRAASCCRSSNQFVVGLRHAGAGRHRPADGLRPARAAVPAPDGARTAPSHHDQHGRRGVPRRRRRVRHREPGDERHLPAGDVDRGAGGHVRRSCSASTSRLRCCRSRSCRSSTCVSGTT